jgi:hypothetical protein
MIGEFVILDKIYPKKRWWNIKEDSGSE